MAVEFTDNSNTVREELERKCAEALEMIGLVAEGNVATITPVDTGRLRASISHEVDDRTAVIGTNVEYAPFVELGTSSQKAQPYLKPGVESGTSQYQTIVERVFKG